MSQGIMTEHDFDQTAIAICGIGLRLPGGIKRPSDLWKFLLDGRDARQPIPLSRWNTSGFNDSLGWKSAIQTKFGYFLEEDIAVADTAPFSMTRSEIEKCDPQQRILLEVVRECFEDAGETDYRGAKVACYVGTSGEDWLRMSAQEPLHVGGGVMSGGSDIMLANRVSYEYGLTGPSMVVKTGCSSSLVALHDACNAIRAGSATSAIVAGSAMNMDPTQTTLMTAEGILSPDGSCKPFDSSANGFARAEAINAIFIKPLKDAIRDGNPVRAVIRGVGSNNDGKSNGFAQPNGPAQEALIRSIYTAAGLDVSETAYVECHGTGTPVGDPIEVNAIGNVFGDRGVFIGSLKANLGHAEPASGINGVVKAVLALEHKTIPPQIKFETPNPKIAFEAKKLVVTTEACPLPGGRAHRISVNSFGIGGSNAHAVIEAYDVVRETTECQYNRPELLLHSAATAWSVEQHVSKFKQLVEEKNDATFNYNLAFTLARHREISNHRAFSLVGPGEVIFSSDSIAAPPRADQHQIVMIFSGQGAQWAQMGRSLIEGYTDFREDLQRMDHVLHRLPHPPAWNIVDELLRPSDVSRINEAQIAQPLCTALQVAITNLLRSLGIVPRAVIGHSSGEICAAYAAGHISMEHAITVAYYRGFAATRSRGGGMAAVGLGPDALRALLPEEVVIACENSSQSSTISGPATSVAAAESVIKARYPDAFFRILRVDQAYHSAAMNEVAKAYMEFIDVAPLAGVDTKAQTVGSTKFYSTVSGGVIDPEQTKRSDYWMQNLVSPVKFNDAVNSLLSDSTKIFFLEVGPAAVLSGPLRQILTANSLSSPYVSAMERDKDSGVSLQRAIGTVYQYGMDINLKALYPGGVVLQDLPTYSWDHSQSFWWESRLSKEHRLRAFPPHSLLGVRVLASADHEPVWRNVLHVENEPWLSDHRIGRDIVYPFTAYVAMAGEAMRQLHNGDGGYSAERISVHTALVVPQSTGVELITSFQRRGLKKSANSKWWDFRICAYKSGGWKIHATGRIKALGAASLPLKPKDRNEILPRQVPRSYFYETLHKLGLNFGRDFQRLEEIRSSANDDETTSRGKIITYPTDPPNRYASHPAIMDAGFQLLAVAKWAGLPRNFNPPLAPMYAERITVWPSTASTFEAEAFFAKQNDSNDNTVELIDHDQCHLQMIGVTLKPIPTSTSSDDLADKHAAARVTWLPDVTFLDPRSLIQGKPILARQVRPLVEQFMLLCTLETADQVRGLTPCKPYLSKHREWLEQRTALARDGSIPLVKDCHTYASMTSKERRDLIEDVRAQLSKLGAPSSVECAERIYQEARAIFLGDTDPLECLTEGELLSRTYTEASIDLGPYVSLLAHKNPKLRILEVGAGLGGTTDGILRALHAENQVPTYATYTFTDISSGFFPAARERFSFAPNLDFHVFDITRPAADQGLELHTYDLVVACNVIHATPLLADALTNIREVLKPDGQIIITELCSESKNATYIFGQLPTWWLGTEPYREWNPLADTSQWDAELKKAGFSGVDSCIYDDQEPFQVCSTIISTASEDAATTTSKRELTLLCADSTSPWATRMVTQLSERGWNVQPRRLQDDMAKDNDVVACLDMEGCFMENLSTESFARFQHLMSRLERRRLLWLMPSTQVHCTNPRASPSLGMLRTVRNELDLELYTLEMDPAEPNFAALAEHVLQHIQVSEFSSGLHPDREYAVVDGTICIGRYHSFTLPDEIGQQAAGDKEMRLLAQVSQPGMVDSIRWVQSPVDTPLSEDSVEVEVRAVGLNFADVLRAMNMIETATRSPRAPGFEFAGVVKSRGSKVTHVGIGDRVVGFAPDGCLTSKVSVPSNLVTNIPCELSFEEAATIPCCFTTVWISLMDVASLEKGQSVLIHSAAGGVGLAALQICQMVGAEIHVTVGNQEKADYISSRYGIPESRIYSSRDDSFISRILQQTDGKGVDIVLNSLSGDLLHASWMCVAKYGTMIELGKQDLQSNGQLDMQPFLANRTYAAVDLLAYSVDRPERVGRLLSDLMELCREGRIAPLSPRTDFAADDVIHAFRYLQNGSHIGKVVVRTTNHDPKNADTHVSSSLQLRGDRSYLITGGLGGLGRSIATWLVQRGARHLTILSRTAGSSDMSHNLAAELQQMGCNAIMVPGKVDEVSDVQRALAACNKPLAGVIHLAMVLRDVSFLSMTLEQLTDVMRPKIQGAWNLHSACQEQNLDFFWMSSSVNTIFEQPGQANYAAANVFLEAFAQFRHGLGLPASVLNICPIAGVGYVAENPHARRIGDSMGIISLGESEFLDCVELSLLQSRPTLQSWTPLCTTNPRSWSYPSQFVMGLCPDRDLHDNSNHTVWRLDRRMGHFHNVRRIDNQKSSENGDALQNLLLQANHDPDILAADGNKQLVASEIGKRVYDFMMITKDEVDPNLKLRELGLDSLMSIELRRWFRQLFSIEVSVLEILDSDSLLSLADFVIKEKIKERQVR